MVVTFKEDKEIYNMDNDFKARNYKMKWEYQCKSHDPLENNPISKLDGEYYKIESGNVYRLV